jgi:flagellar basal-body rod modification protein FlgD
MQTTAVTPFSSAATTQANRGVTSMNSEDFFKLLITELRQQDPLEPSKTSDMIGQVSQIRSIELSKQLTDALSQLTSQQHTAGASELLGKSITATLTDEEGTDQEITGIVTGVRFDSDGSAVLELDTGQAVPAANVTHIATASSAPATTSTTTTEAASKSAQAAKSSSNESAGLLPWLNLEGSFKL